MLFHFIVTLSALKKDFCAVVAAVAVGDAASSIAASVYTRTNAGAPFFSGVKSATAGRAPGPTEKAPTASTRTRPITPRSNARASNTCSSVETCRTA